MPGDKLFLTRNQSSIVAFSLGKKFDPEKSVFKIIGAHTDSPSIRLCPNSKCTKHGYMSVAVQLYGGGIWHTWFDRDLTIAGRIIVKDQNTQKLSSLLLPPGEALLRIPNLAIHFSRKYDTFEFNLEKHTCPIIGTTIVNDLFN